MNWMRNKAMLWKRKQITRLYVWCYSKCIWHIEPTEQLKLIEESCDVLVALSELAEKDPYYKILFDKLFAVNLAVFAVIAPEHYDILRQKYDWLPEVES